MHSNILTTGTITETRRSHEFDRQTWALVCSVIALVWVATSQGSGGRSPDDRLYYKKIRKNVGFAPPAWLFGPVWSVWIIFIILNTTFFANNPVVEANTDLYEASFILFLAWIFTFAIWTPLFFRGRMIFLCIIDSILLFLITVAQLVVQVHAGETRWALTYLLLLPIALWILFATILTTAIFVNRKQINASPSHHVLDE